MDRYIGECTDLIPVILCTYDESTLQLFTLKVEYYHFLEFSFPGGVESVLVL